jgi:tetratricopeptide (TPR) repeat protein
VTQGAITIDLDEARPTSQITVFLRRGGCRLYCSNCHVLLIAPVSTCPDCGTPLNNSTENPATLPGDRTEASRRTGGHKTPQRSGHLRAWVAVPLVAVAVLCLIALFSCGKSAEDYNSEGLDQYKAGQYELAANSFNEAIRIDPKNAAAYIDRGGMYWVLGRYRLAIDSFDQGIDLVGLNPKGLNPKVVRAYRYRGLCYAALGDTTMALANYQRAAELGDTEARAYAQQIIRQQRIADSLRERLFGGLFGNRGSSSYSAVPSPDEMEDAAKRGAKKAIEQDRLLHGEW